MSYYARQERVPASVASCSMSHQPLHSGKAAIGTKARHSGSPGQYANLSSRRSRLEHACQAVVDGWVKQALHRPRMCL